MRFGIHRVEMYEFPDEDAATFSLLEDAQLSSSNSHPTLTPAP